jgi:2-phospho-L-lactate guanylyltransferase
LGDTGPLFAATGTVASGRCTFVCHAVRDGPDTLRGVTATTVVPFRAGGKSRLPASLRVEVALAMLGDVLDAVTTFGPARLVTADPAARLIGAELGATLIDDPGGGQGAAVQAALVGLDGPCLVVNADVPRVRPSDLAALAIPPRAGAVAVAAAADGTTNALGLPYAEVFQPLYGAGSAAQFRAHAAALGLAYHDLALPSLRDDVDTVEDLDQIGGQGGRRTRALTAALSS